MRVSGLHFDVAHVCSSSCESFSRTRNTDNKDVLTHKESRIFWAHLERFQDIFSMCAPGPGDAPFYLFSAEANGLIPENPVPDEAGR